MRAIEWMDDSTIDLMTPKLLEPHPNTYTYSKRLAESLVRDQQIFMPCAIVRPSIGISEVIHIIRFYNLLSV